LNFDSNGDSIKDNDVDSEVESPAYTYSKSGVYRTKLTVEDNLGNKTPVINFVYAKSEASATESTDTSGTSTDRTGMEADLLGAVNQNQISAMVLSLILFAIVTLSIYLHSVRLEKLQTAVVKSGRKISKKKTNGNLKK